MMGGFRTALIDLFHGRSHKSEVIVLSGQFREIFHGLYNPGGICGLVEVGDSGKWWNLKATRGEGTETCALQAVSRMGIKS